MTRVLRWLLTLPLCLSACSLTIATPTPTPTLTEASIPLTPSLTPTATPTEAPIALTPSPPSPVVYSELVALRTYHNTYLTAMDDQPGWAWELRSNSEAVHAWEEFTLLHLANGKVALKTYHGRFVSAINSVGCGSILRAAALERGVSEEFTLEPVGDRVAFKTANGYYITAGNADWNWLVRSETAALSYWEQFELVFQSE